LKNKAKNQLNLNQYPNSSKKNIVQKSRPNKVGEKSIYLQAAIGQRATHAYRIQAIFHSSMAEFIREVFKSIKLLTKPTNDPSPKGSSTCSLTWFS